MNTGELGESCIGYLIQRKRKTPGHLMTKSLRVAGDQKGGSGESRNVRERGKLEASV